MTSNTYVNNLKSPKTEDKIVSTVVISVLIFVIVAILAIFGIFATEIIFDSLIASTVAVLATCLASIVVVLKVR